MDLQVLWNYNRWEELQKSSENSPSRFDLCFNKMIEHYNSYFKRKINKTRELQIRVPSEVSSQSQQVREQHHRLRIMEERELREVGFQVENPVSARRKMIQGPGNGNPLHLLWQGPGQQMIPSVLQLSSILHLHLSPSQQMNLLLF